MRAASPPLLFALALLATAARAQFLPEFPSDPARPTLTLGPDRQIKAFSNSLWPTYDPRAIRVRVSESTVADFLTHGKILPATSENWDLIRTGHFTLPESVRKRYSAALQAVATDPSAFAIFCEGTLVLPPHRILYWAVVDDRTLYLSDATADCLLRTDAPIPIHDTLTAYATADFFTRPSPPVDAITIQPPWMQTFPPTHTPDLADITDLFIHGQYLPGRFLIGRDSMDFAALPLGQTLPSTTSLSAAATQAIRAVDQYLAKSPETHFPRGVLYTQGRLVYWRSLSPDLLELRVGRTIIGYKLRANQ